MMKDPYQQLKLYNLFMYGSWSLLNPFLPLYFQNIGFSNVQIGLLMSVGPIISLFANPFWGYWSDRTQNTKRIILIMLTGNLFLSQIFFQMDLFITVFALMTLFYFFQTAMNPLTNSLILHSIQGTEHSFGSYRLWGSIGFAIMVLAASPLIQWSGVENLGYMYSSFLLITLLLAFRLPKQGKKSGGKRFTGKDLFRLLSRPLFAIFLVLTVLISIPNRMNSTFISVFISDLGGTEVAVGWSWFFAAIVEVPIFLLLDRYLKTTAKAMFGLMGIVAVLYALRWLLMSWSTEPMHIVLIQLMHSVTFGITMYTGTHLSDFLVPERFRTSGQAIYGLVWMGIAGIIAGVLGGYLFDTFGARLMYSASSVMSIVGATGFFAIWLWYLQNEFRSKRNPRH